jgi:hypothetical protein
MELSGAAFLPDPDASVPGPVTFEWIEQGAALVMCMGGGGPTATWIIGRDESESDYCVLYTDDRGVSRVHRMSFTDRTRRMWRDTPEFAQGFDAEVSPSQTEITSNWQKSADGGKTGSTISWSTTAALHRADTAVDGRSVAESRRWSRRQPQRPINPRNSVMSK